MVCAGPGATGRSGRPLRSGPIHVIWHAIWHDELDSTNEEARRLAEGDVPREHCTCCEGSIQGRTIVAALRQTAGKGQRGRSWISLPGNLNASFLLRPGPPAGKAPELGFAAALAVADTLSRYLHPSLRPRLKWPNDVLLAGGKIAGILIESAAAPDIQKNWAVIGIGVNLTLAPADMPYPCEALSTFAIPPGPKEFLPLLASSLEVWLARLESEGFAPIAAAWLALGPCVGEEISVRTGTDIVAGRFAGLGPGGALLVETSTETRKLVSGEIFAPAPVIAGSRRETGGPPGPEPTRYGDWQFKGRVSDF